VESTPPYDDSLAAFLHALDVQGFSKDLVWVFREDITNCIHDYWIREPVPVANAQLARDYFEYGREQGRGVTLEVVCRLGGRSVCYVWVPEYDEDASYAMQRPLKIMTPVEPVEGFAVHSGLRWRWLCLDHRWRRCVRLADRLPLRAEVERRTNHCTRRR
jgi:hypothetical protein